MSELILRTRELTRRYGRTLALDRASLSVEKGQILGLVGRNGAGKTTLIRLISGQSRPTSGELALFGASSPSALDRARSRTGVMVETPAFYPYLTAEQNLEYYRIQRGIPGRSCVDEALELVRLTGAGKKKFKTFSLGMKQRLGLALALMNQPEFLLLDEPINGLDPEGIVEFRELLLRLNRERQTTILISSHILSELSALATHYAFIDRGRMLETISAADLRERCRDCLELRVDDAARAAQVPEEQNWAPGILEVLPQERLRLYAFLDQPQTVNRVLMEQGVGLISAQQKDSNLEDYFLSLIDGHSAGKEGV
ncbi:MAG: ABC transporter ATP-binding protein [Lawsonibacter sp.]